MTKYACKSEELSDTFVNLVKKAAKSAATKDDGEGNFIRSIQNPSTGSIGLVNLNLILKSQLKIHLFNCDIF